MVKCPVPGCTDGWLHYSTGSPLDVCEDCHGTGWASAYSAFEELLHLRELAQLAVGALKGNVLMPMEEYRDDVLSDQSRRAAQFEDAVERYQDTSSE